MLKLEKFLFFLVVQDKSFILKQVISIERLQLSRMYQIDTLMGRYLAYNICDTGAALYQLSQQANWELVMMLVLDKPTWVGTCCWF